MAHRDAIPHDACGIGLIADLAGRPRRDVVVGGLTALARLTHRGGSAVLDTVDGCGLLTAIPWRLLDGRAPASARGPRAVGVFFMPAGSDLRPLVAAEIERVGARVTAWRLAPVDADALPPALRDEAPAVWHALIALDGARDSEQALHVARVRMERRAIDSGAAGFTVVSLSTRTMVYKALVAPVSLPRFYRDLDDPRFVSPFVVFHQRFSTNTTADWSLAQPFRLIGHNGEINTISGNRVWWQARLADAASCPAGVVDAIDPGGSDSQSLDRMLDWMRVQGMTLPHAIARLLPPAWERDREMADEVRAFHQLQALVAEPWEGPAALVFSDGLQVGAALDRNGLRPARVLKTADGLLAVASEVGVLDDEERIVERGRIGPGEMLTLDLATGALRGTADLLRLLARRHACRRLVDAALVQLPALVEPARPPADDLLPRQIAFGCSREEIDVILRPMATEAHEAVGSMGDDAPPAGLSDRDRLFTDYFRQRFAQVTNPPLDPHREAASMSLRTLVGAQGAFFDETERPRRVALHSPVLAPAQLQALVDTPWLNPVTLSTTFDPAGGGPALESAIDRLVREACDAVRRGTAAIVLSDRGVDATRAAAPALLAASAVHHGLIAAGLRTRTSVLVETGDARDAHGLAALIGFGATAVCPYLGYETVAALVVNGHAGGSACVSRYRLALQRGLLRVLSKMGVCTSAAYCGAQLFDTLGLDRTLVEKYFPGTAAPLGGIGLDAIAASIAARHARAFGGGAVLDHPGLHGFRRNGEYHATNPLVVRHLQRARTEGRAAYDEFTNLVYTRPPTAIRDLVEFRAARPIRIEEVEPASAICRRFFASAMSVGALAPEAHRAIAIAMNRLGARSNSGEGGEEPERYARPAEGDWDGSGTKQVASARFGVTAAYLRSADELQIKIAQGSKPGEGGQLPGDKVVAHIARLRHARPGTPLISPPVHHDIYSIEDLAQLIFDLRAVHPSARINVKLVAEIGIGIVAAGVVKAGADAIQISGHDGGTGASPRSSIKHAGLPWEIGLAEAHRVLTHHGLRGHVVLQTDGGFKTGRDVAVAAALGAEEFGFGTAALVAVGCVMARQCHLNTCPAGIATQRADLRAKFDGTPDMLIRYLELVAQEVREILARLGLRRVADLVGRADLLQPRTDTAGRAAALDVTPILQSARAPRDRRTPRRHPVVPPLDAALARRVARLTRPPARPMLLSGTIANDDRAIGAAVAGEIAARFGDEGLPRGSVRLELTGSAGQSFGAFAVGGMSVVVTGAANDYVAKGMHGGEVVVRPHPRERGRPDQVLAGNTVLYGATGGRLFVGGRAGERFAVRNSGATAVVEGIGDHGCEYMTGGVVVVLGSVGRNFAAGMSGGIAYVHDPIGRSAARCNPEAVATRPLDATDRRLLRELLLEHQRATGSRIARHLLRAGDAALNAFVKIEPSAIAVPEPAAAEVQAAGA